MHGVLATDLPTAKITAIILAGGRGQRVGGVDKGLITLNGRSLAQWVLGCIRPQVAEILISANRHLEAYHHLGFPVLCDELPDFPGPLAGILQGLKRASHALLLCVPCDTPFLPPDLVDRLMFALQTDVADIAVVTVDGKTQPVIFLGRKDVLYPSLENYCGDGGRRVSVWQRGLKQVLVAFDDETERFRNLNTHGELRAIQDG